MHCLIAAKVKILFVSYVFCYAKRLPKAISETLIVLIGMFLFDIVLFGIVLLGIVLLDIVLLDIVLFGNVLLGSYLAPMQ